MNETRISADLRLDIDVPGDVEYWTHESAAMTVVSPLSLTSGLIRTSPHLSVLLPGYTDGWDLASQHMRAPMAPATQCVTWPHVDCQVALALPT